MEHNDDLIPLRVMGLSYNQLQNGAYALVLEQTDGPYRIPIVIGAPEAQAIAIALEGIVTERPLTHDLFSTFAQAFGVQLTRVYIYNFKDGIFCSELTFSDGKRTITLDARASDSVALAMRAHAPIYTNQDVLDETGFILEDATPDPAQQEDELPSLSSADATIEEMEQELQRLIDAEDYEAAGRLNRLIQERKNSAGDDPETTAD